MVCLQQQVSAEELSHAEEVSRLRENSGGIRFFVFLNLGLVLTAAGIMNNIAKVGTDSLGDTYELVSELDGANAILVRSANLNEVEFPKSLLAIARAGAGVNNIPVDRCAEEGIVVFNTPGANANAVKELVLAGMLLASRDIIGGKSGSARTAMTPT